MTREQMAIIIYRVMLDKGYELEIAKEYDAFTDEAEIADYALEVVNNLYEKGLVNGTGNNGYSPKACGSKAQGSTILFRLLELL